MLRTVLVDDEVDSIRVLKNLLTTSCPEVSIVGEAGSVQSAMKVIPACMPDLLLLDIAINNETAFDLLNGLNTTSFQTILILCNTIHHCSSQSI